MRGARDLATVGLLAIVLGPGSAAAGQLRAPEQRPLIAHGAPAEPCAWPTVVSVEGGSVCSGTLVHPRVVLYAAHCGGETKTIRFGELSGEGGQTVAAERCAANPAYAGADDQGRDWAYCLLRDPVELPLAPPIYGCETEVLDVGTEVAIVGFGETEGGETGVKRWAATSLVALTPGNNTSLVGDPNAGSTPSICTGDSGGPGLVQLADGSWRTFGIASTVVGECGGYGAHALVPAAVAWVEFDSGVDITPCHELDGTWSPSPACDGLFGGASDGTSPSSGAWADWCAGTSVVALGESCGAQWDSFDPGAAPLVEFVAPAPGQHFPSASTVEVLVDARRDPEGYAVARVEFSLDGQPIDSDESQPYALTLDGLADGEHVLVAAVETWAEGRFEHARSFSIGELPEGAGTDTGGAPVDADGGACQCAASTGGPAPIASLALTLLGIATVARRRRRSAPRSEQ